MSLAPIVLFTYNRLEHTKKTIEALKANLLAIESELYIYSDAAKTDGVQSSVNEVRTYLEGVTGFKKITLIKREKNWGLADSIIDGVSNLVKQSGKVIVLEDDLVTRPYFLTFMNDALDYYQNEKQVWHISGWNFPIDTDKLDDVFLWRGMNCWGWATWADRWQHFERNPEKLVDTFSKQDIARFDLDNKARVFWRQVLQNYHNEKKTWAIFWYATIFKNDGLCVNPVKTYVDNIGEDGSGENCIVKDSTNEETFTLKSTVEFANNTSENMVALREIKRYYAKRQLPVHVRIINRLKTVIQQRTGIQ